MVKRERVLDSGITSEAIERAKHLIAVSKYGKTDQERFVALEKVATFLLDNSLALLSIADVALAASITIPPSPPPANAPFMIVATGRRHRTTIR